MDQIQKTIILAELTAVKAMVSSLGASTNGIMSPIYPVSGNVVTIAGLPQAANAIRMQGDAIESLIKIIEKLVDKV